MFNDPEAAEVAAPVAGDEPVAGAAEDGGKEGAADERKVAIPREEYDSLVESSRKRRELEAENQRLRSESNVRSTTTDNRAGDADNLRQRLAERAQYISQLRVAAENPNNIDARALMAVHDSIQEMEYRQLFRLEMEDIPKDKREAVKRYMVENRQSSPLAAYREMRAPEADSMEAEVASLRARIAELEKPKAKVETTRMPGSVTKPSKPADTNGKMVMTPDEYAEGMNDPEKRKDIMTARRERRLELVTRRK